MLLLLLLLLLTATLLLLLLLLTVVAVLIVRSIGVSGASCKCGAQIACVASQPRQTSAKSGAGRDEKGTQKTRER